MLKRVPTNTESLTPTSGWTSSDSAWPGWAIMESSLGMATFLNATPALRPRRPETNLKGVTYLQETETQANGGITFVVVFLAEHRRPPDKYTWAEGQFCRPEWA